MTLKTLKDREINLPLTGVAVAQPYFFKYRTQYFAKFDFKTTVLTKGCFFDYDFHYAKTVAYIGRKEAKMQKNK